VCVCIYIYTHTHTHTHTHISGVAHAQGKCDFNNLENYLGGRF